MDDSPLWWPADRLITAYEQRELSPVEVTRLAEARIEEVNSYLHAFSGATTALARQQAREAETSYRRGTAGPLSGVPVSIKDAFDIEGHVTTLGSRAHIDDIAPADSSVVSRLREAGAVFVGKTNVSEFCQSATSANLLGPETANPWDPTRTSGGSSGGAAASVAAGACTVALGSDGGGSIRIPAAFCGLVGFKPTYGLIRDHGRFSAFSHFISAGPLARTVADAVRLDAVLRQEPTPAIAAPSGLRIGWCSEPEQRPIDAHVAASMSTGIPILEELGHTVGETDLDIGGWEEIFGPLVLAEEGHRRGHLLDSEIELSHYERSSLQAARELPAEVVTSAEVALKSYRERVDRTFDHFDVLVTPATAVTAFKREQRPTAIDGRPVSRLWGAFPFAVPFNVSAHPAVVLPVGFVDGLPVGLQLIGRLGEDARLLALAHWFETALALDPFSRLREIVVS